MLYLMIENDVERWLSIETAGVLFDSGWSQVEMGNKVMEDNGTVRPMTEPEKDKIVSIADIHSWSK